MSRQLPARHCVIAFAREHASPQAPQCASVLLRFVSQPSPDIRLQSPLPAGHINVVVVPHTPARQVAVCPVWVGQRLLHIRQFWGSVLRLVSQPLVGLRSQSEKPAMQVKSQLPARHTATALGGTTQARPHPPQFIASLCVFTSQPFA